VDLPNLLWLNNSIRSPYLLYQIRKWILNWLFCLYLCTNSWLRPTGISWFVDLLGGFRLGSEYIKFSTRIDILFSNFYSLITYRSRVAWSCSGAATLEPSMLAYPAVWWGHWSICLSILVSYASTLASIRPFASKDNYGTAQSCFMWLKFIFQENEYWPVALLDCLQSSSIILFNSIYACTIVLFIYPCFQWSNCQFCECVFRLCHIATLECGSY